ncbi:MAG: hypothetical protein ISS46_02020 [Candidatus Omnitrophica bacterium]|nr:hypothetical protein [Candidatus Omnitrophota bacterium]
MLFFIDESWQSTKDQKYKVGVLGAISIHSQDFNEYSRQIYNFKINHLGSKAGNIEIKGRAIFKRYLFTLEQKGISSDQLNLARDIFKYIKTHGSNAFASVTFEKEEIALECANINQLERPFFFLRVVL